MIEWHDIAWEASIYKTWTRSRDCIAAFDTEATTCYELEDGTIIRAVDELPHGAIPHSVTYIWMFGLRLGKDTIVTYGRTIQEFGEFMKILTKGNKDQIVCYVHNLAYDFVALENVTSDWDVFATKPHKVLRATSIELGIQMRCSYLLTGQSLDAAAKTAGAEHQKRVGDLDYSILRSPGDDLTDEELGYCEFDILSLLDVIDNYLTRYRHTKSIPSTATATIRKCAELAPMREHDQKVRTMRSHPRTAKGYALLMSAFRGGDAHANRFYSGMILDNVESWDLASDYPYQMIANKYPCTGFHAFRGTIDDMTPETDAYLMTCRFYGLRSRTRNTYLSLSHGIEHGKCQLDNGRIVYADEFSTTFTDADWWIIQRSYTWDAFILESCVTAKKDYLPRPFVDYILTLYEAKTAHKGVPEMKAQYEQIDKPRINGCYGMTVTRAIRQNVTYDAGEWKITDLTEDEITEKLQSMRKGTESTFLSAAYGIYITAYARKSLWEMVLELDKDWAYNDTDSGKVKEGNRYAFIRRNERVREEIRVALTEQGFDPARAEPSDSKGVPHHIGLFEYEGTYKKFRTWGAKKYAYEDEDGIHVTVAGLAKSGAKYLRSLEDFKPGKRWEAGESGRTVAYYLTEQKPFVLNGYVCEQKRAIAICPTSYTLGIAAEYDKLIHLSWDSHGALDPKYVVDRRREWKR